MSPAFEISIPHFYSLEYREAGRLLTLDIDFRDPVIYLDDALVLTWAPPYAAEPIGDSERRRILDNVYDYLVKQRGFALVEYNKG
ncbi:MAG TPA: hypothetical protein VN631_06765 [Negativicutes bacterium]|nr:hypothetical protein [Negativicutes bacterium]